MNINSKPHGTLNLGRDGRHSAGVVLSEPGDFAERGSTGALSSHGFDHFSRVIGFGISGFGPLGMGLF